MHEHNSETRTPAHPTPDNNRKLFTIPVRVSATVALLAGIGRTYTAYNLYGAEYAYHAAIPLLPICAFFCLFAFLINDRSKPLSVIAVLAGLFSGSLI